mmetsp:Transcript_16633/g.15938  ORF Transcript_16633/g.15938 Transcript_16633/m.15938 type:complete len:83 (+) Transcript_16633:1116-1364(+)
MRDLEAMLKQCSEEHECLNYHRRAIIETIKNDMQRRDELQDGEMRVKAEGDVKKSTGYLYYVLVKLGWPKIQVRSIGRAMDT